MLPTWQANLTSIWQKLQKVILKNVALVGDGEIQDKQMSALLDIYSMVTFPKTNVCHGSL